MSAAEKQKVVSEERNRIMNILKFTGSQDKLAHEMIFAGRSVGEACGEFDKVVTFEQKAEREWMLSDTLKEQYATAERYIGHKKWLKERPARR